MRPARKRLGLAIKAGTVTTAAVAAMFTAPAAHAATTTVVRATKWVGGCEAILYSNSLAQTSAKVYMSSGADGTYECTGWLERQSSSGSSWLTVSGYHTISKRGTSARTGWYADAWPKRSAACVEKEGYGPYGDIKAACTEGW